METVKKTLEAAKAELDVRAHNSSIENLANASRYVAEARERAQERLKKELEDLAEIDAEIDALAANTPLNSEAVFKVYSKATQKKFADR